MRLKSTIRTIGAVPAAAAKCRQVWKASSFLHNSFHLKKSVQRCEDVSNDSKKLSSFSLLPVRFAHKQECLVSGTQWGD
jgi:hypothetical protein